MSDRLVALHAMMVRFEALDCWHTVELLRELIKAELEKCKEK